MLLVRWALRVPPRSAGNQSRERSITEWRDLAGEGREVRPDVQVPNGRAHRGVCNLVGVPPRDQPSGRHWGGAGQWHSPANHHVLVGL